MKNLRLVRSTQRSEPTDHAREGDHKILNEKKLEKIFDPEGRRH